MDAVDAIQAVVLSYDTMMSEIDSGKMRVFLSGIMFDVEWDGRSGRMSIPFCKEGCTVFRKAMSTEGAIHEFVPTLRTEAGGLRTALDGQRVVVVPRSCAGSSRRALNARGTL